MFESRLKNFSAWSNQHKWSWPALSAYSTTPTSILQQPMWKCFVFYFNFIFILSYLVILVASIPKDTGSKKLHSQYVFYACILMVCLFVNRFVWRWKYMVALKVRFIYLFIFKFVYDQFNNDEAHLLRVDLLRQELNYFDTNDSFDPKCISVSKSFYMMHHNVIIWQLLFVSLLCIDWLIDWL